MTGLLPYLQLKEAHPTVVRPYATQNLQQALSMAGSSCKVQARVAFVIRLPGVRPKRQQQSSTLGVPRSGCHVQWGCTLCVGGVQHLCPLEASQALPQ